MKRLTLFVSGNVQRAGYRDKVVEIGRHLNLRGYAENLPDARVRIVAEGEEETLNKFLDAVYIKNVLINVEHIDHSFSNAMGEFFGFRKLVGVGETDERLDAAAELMKELIGVIRNGFSETVSAVKSVKADTSAMLEKQDITIDVLKSVKEDTAQIRQDTSQIPKIVENTKRILEHTSHLPAIKDNTERILEYTSYIPAMRADTAAIRTDTREIAAKLWEKYEELSREIAEMKITLSRIEAKVFG